MIIKDKTFLIGGGASGLGLASAQKIVASGGKVILADINEEAGKSALELLGDQACFVKTDVTQEESVKNAIQIGLKKFSTINGLVNCAGIGPAQRVLGRESLHSLESFEKVIKVNLVGTFNLLRLTAHQMQQNAHGEDGERGVIINTASVAAFEGQIGQAAYSASKGGIVAMTLPIAREFARFGIRVMTIAPGIFETPMLLNLPEEAKESLGSQIPFPSRLGKPEEFARLVAHIIENTMLNGEVIRLDGAIRMASK
ncbi:SDR family NAD(P)-dependent oxidoreductase [Allomuricauda sp. NBRC 101325]|uniref:SDR family NAD(P)-dependent oxidoreductase n=1 Tax=Allomuricauda sp. NBRC 101325 TaxID=1113758 RepID=UPI0024A512CB|nr:SDR family NAD(P)-dependent oxidoreductase [Muricauda sp. NBRC 101325]GLU43950.1 3-hydroxyacyl-CoA dehydrogenase [Muricauda sp. NBRC 101325]